MIAAAALDVTSLAVALIGGGFVTGLVALLKFKPEKDAIVVSAAQGAVVVQSGVIDALQDELDRSRADLASLRTMVEGLQTELTAARGERDEFKARMDAAERDRDEVKRRLAASEKKNRELQKRVDELEGR